MTELNLHFWVGFVLGILTTIAFLEVWVSMSNRNRKKKLERMKRAFNADYIVRERERIETLKTSGQA